MSPVTGPERPGRVVRSIEAALHSSVRSEGARVPDRCRIGRTKNAICRVLRVLHQLDDRRVRGGTDQLFDPRVPGQLGLVDVDRQHLAPTEHVADTREIEGATSRARPRLDDQPRPDLGEDLLIDPEIEGALVRPRAKVSCQTFDS
jgi:hypothetical protein